MSGLKNGLIEKLMKAYETGTAERGASDEKEKQSAEV